MKKLLLIIFTMASAIMVFGQVTSNPERKMNYKTGIDTLFVIKKTDSLVTSILKTYDKNSLRQTGVPLSIEHYDKTVYFDPDKNNILVTYCFNKTKFYGPNSSELVVKDIDKYPFHLNICFDMKTNIATQGKLVENR